MYCDGIQTIRNCGEKKKTMRVNGAFWRYLKRFGTADKKMKTRTLTHAFWENWKRYLKLQREKQYMFWLNQRGGAWGRPTFRWKCENRDGYCCILTLFETIFWNNGDHFENKDDKWCILPLFDTIFWLEEDILKAIKLNGAFWRVLIG